MYILSACDSDGRASWCKSAGQTTLLIKCAHCHHHSAGRNRICLRWHTDTEKHYIYLNT